MKRRWFLIAGLILILLAAGWFYYIYQKPRADVASVEAAHTLSAEKLYTDFVTDEAAADKRYTDKIIEVRGVVSEVQSTDNSIVVLLAAGNDTGGINCSFQHHNVSLPKKGQMITVKGKCTGFLMDVNLVDAVFVK
jgi:hypothetical protein